MKEPCQGLQRSTFVSSWLGSEYSRRPGITVQKAFCDLTDLAAYLTHPCVSSAVCAFYTHIHSIIFWLLICISCQTQALRRQQPSLAIALRMPSALSDRKKIFSKYLLYTFAYLPILNHHTPPSCSYRPFMPYFSLYHLLPFDTCRGGRKPFSSTLYVF